MTLCGMKDRENILLQKQRLLFVVGLILFCNMTQLYWTLKHESSLNEIFIRIILASILSALVSYFVLVFLKKYQNIF